VQDGVYDAFTKRLAETAGAMKVADGFEPGAVIGPLIDMKAVEKVEAHVGAKNRGHVRNTRRHCEERRDEAIWVGSGSQLGIVSRSLSSGGALAPTRGLAMTSWGHCEEPPGDEAISCSGFGGTPKATSNADARSTRSTASRAKTRRSRWPMIPPS
jgi:hypothetical protein